MECGLATDSREQLCLRTDEVLVVLDVATQLAPLQATPVHVGDPDGRVYPVGFRVLNCRGPEVHDGRSRLFWIFKKEAPRRTGAHVWLRLSDQDPTRGNPVHAGVTFVRPDLAVCSPERDRDPTGVPLWNQMNLWFSPRKPNASGNERDRQRDDLHD